MEALHRGLDPEGFSVVAVNIREGRNQVERYIEALGLSFPVLLDRAGATSIQYGVWATPTHVLVKPDGRIVAAGVGPVAWDHPEVVQWVRQALRFPPSLRGEQQTELGNVRTEVTDGRTLSGGEG